MVSLFQLTLITSGPWRESITWDLERDTTASTSKYLTFFINNSLAWFELQKEPELEAGSVLKSRPCKYKLQV